MIAHVPLKYISTGTAIILYNFIFAPMLAVLLKALETVPLMLSNLFISSLRPSP
jgi:hypothetical protein